MEEGVTGEREQEVEPASAGERSAERAGDALLACALLAGGTLAYYLLRSPFWFSDARFFLDLLERDKLASHHVAFPWVVGALRWLLAPFGVTAHTTLELLSALSGGLAMMLTFVAARCLHRSRPLALAATA